VNKHVPGRTQIRVNDLARFMDAAMTDGDLRAKPEIRMRLHHEIGKVFEAADNREMALKHMNLALALGNFLYSVGDYRMFEIHTAMANAFLRDKAFSEAESHARSALALAEDPRLPNVLVASDALERLARIQREQGAWGAAETNLRRAIEMCAREGTNVDRWAARYLALGELYSAQHLLPEARTAFEEGLALVSASELSNSHVEARLRLQLGKIAYWSGAMVDAEASLSEAAKFRIAHSGLGYWSTYVAVLWHGRALAALGRHMDAIERFEQSLVWREQSPDEARTAQIRFELAAALLAAGRNDEASRNLVRAVSKGKTTQPGTAKVDALALRAEAALRANDFRVGAALLPRLGDDLAWLFPSDLLPTSRPSEGQ